MKITITNSYCHVSEQLPHEDQVLWAALSYEHPNAKILQKKFDYKFKPTLSHYDKRKKCFLLGLFPLVEFALKERRINYEISSVKGFGEWLPHGPFKLKGISLYDYQEEAVKRFLKERRGILKLSTGAGKCLGKGTPILMFDGTIKNVEDVCVGDKLIGPDSKPRYVTSLARGQEEMFRITPVKGDSFTVNKSHILSLQISGSKHVCGFKNNTIVNIPVYDYIKMSESFKHVAKQWRSSVNFSVSKNLTIPPYILGLWLGDGFTSVVNGFSNPDEEIHSEIVRYATSIGCGVSFYKCEGKCQNLYIVDPLEKTKNRFINMMRKLNLEGNKHIPHSYKTSSMDERLELLAGILDTDGHLSRSGYDFISQHRHIAEDVCFIARSLGLAAYLTPSMKKCQGWDKPKEYYRVSISGDCSIIPCRVKRKKAPARKQVKNVLRTGFSIESIGEGDYYGFEIKGPDHLFLLGDFTVTHNTELSMAVTDSLMVPTIFFTHRTNLMYQTAKRFEQRLPQFKGKFGIIGDGEYSPNFITFATVQTVARRLKEDPDFERLMQGYQLVIVDEAHKMSSESFVEAVSACTNAYYRLGLTATPFMRGDKIEEYNLRGAIGDIIYEVTNSDLIARGLLARPYVKFIPMTSNQPISHLEGYKDVYLHGIVHNKVRNEKIVEVALKLKETKPKILVVTTDVSHAQLLTKMLDDVGLRVEMCTGKTDAKTRQKSLDKLAKGKIDIIVASTIFDEGINVEELGSIILAAGGKSIPALYQRIGRTMRKKSGDENYCIVIDFIDNQHGILLNQSKQRRAIISSEKEFKII